jgi:hypothetical protein
MISEAFPLTHSEPFLETSPTDGLYNCIAWAYGVNDRWFWPDSSGLTFWPENIPHETNVQAFISLFGGIGYEICNDGTLEEGFEKIAIYTNDSMPTHAARQLPSGRWTSKLGQMQDIEHSIFSMSDGVYGNVNVFMKREAPIQNLPPDELAE